MLCTLKTCTFTEDLDWNKLFSMQMLQRKVLYQWKLFLCTSLLFFLISCKNVPVPVPFLFLIIYFVELFSCFVGCCFFALHMHAPSPIEIN